MDCFIKKIIEKKEDEKVHRQFVRFSKGTFEQKFVIGCWITGKLKLNGAFEWANEFVEFVSEIAPKMKVSGVILTREKLDFPGKMKRELNEYEINKEMEAGELKEIADKAYAVLVDIQSGEINLKIKKKLPKPGKGEGKVDDKFCVLEMPLEYKEKIRHAFFSDVHDFKKIKIEHSIIIDKIIIPQGEKDFEKIRVLAKRKGKIIRRINVDGKEEVKEYDLEA
jgi:hypothetical protein